jgi:hypothetical protein
MYCYHLRVEQKRKRNSQVNERDADKVSVNPLEREGG